ncbi:DUF6701 domain-containing protein [Pseudaeromonas paramecii]|uniref:DUF6701 domain-containing protein n=1 Tax=Pseudaeromonas paramecii TaxID=2138166 RepID=A0ABP8QJS8_9GAMM
MRLGWIGALCCLLLTLSVRADILLEGAYTLGDNSTTALSPTQLLTTSNGSYVPVYPLHLTLSQAVSLTGATLAGASGLEAGASLVIWDSSGNLVVNSQASDSSPASFSFSQTLPAGEYRLAVWGQCYSGSQHTRFNASCSDWDDFSFSSITLLGGSSTYQHLTARQHIGDSSEQSGQDRWYPDFPSGSQVSYSITLSQKSTLASLQFYRLRDWAFSKISAWKLTASGSSTVLASGYFTGDGNPSWSPALTLAAGSYVLTVSTADQYGSTTAGRDQDDISWDQVTLQWVAVTTASTSICSPFTGPVQSKQAGGSLYSDGTIYAQQGDVIRFPTIGGNSNRYYCPDSSNSCQRRYEYVEPLSLATFPSTSGSNINVDGSQTLTGSQYGSIQVNSSGKLNLAPSQFPVTIDSLNIDGKVTIAPGEYWIRNLQMNNGQLTLSGSGDLLLYIKANMTLNKSLPTSLGSGQRVVVIAYDQVTINNGTLTAGLYSDKGTVSVNGSIVGPVTVGDRLQINGSGVIDARNWKDYADISAGECTSSSVHHYELHYPASSLTCEPAAVTVKACSDEACTLSNNVSEVTLSPSAGWSDGSPSFTGSSSVTLSHNIAETVILGITDASPSASNGLRCYKDGVLDASCSLSFVDVAYQFDVPDFYAGAGSGSVSLQAVKSSGGSSPVCLPLLQNQTVPVTFAQQYSYPSTGSRSLSINDVSLASSSSRNLSFDASGVASLSLDYPDAGVMGLTATSNFETDDGTLTLTGADSFVVLPQVIRLSVPSAPTCSGSTDAALAACDAFTAVDSPFTLRAQAGYWRGGSFVVTPNFATGSSGQVASGALSWQHQLLAPSQGSAPAQPSSTLSLASGTLDLTTAMADVGVYRYRVPSFVPYAGYQSGSLPVPMASLPESQQYSDAVGRFIPVALLAVAQRQGVLEQTCEATGGSAGFSYLGQSLTYAAGLASQFDVYGLNRSGNRINNYLGNFAKVAADDAYPDADNWSVASSNTASDGGSLAVRLGWQSGSWTLAGSSAASPGLPTFSWSEASTLAYDKSDASAATRALVAPFTPALELTLADLVDSDGVRQSGTLTLNPTAPQTRYGRLLATSVYGAPSADLTLPLYLQYWSGSRFVTAEDDSCSVLPAADLRLNDLAPANWSAVPLADNSEGATTAVTPQNQLTAVAGRLPLLFAAPGGEGHVPVTAQSLPLWWQHVWTSGALSGFAPAKAAFGLYRGHERVIYRREITTP